MSMSRSHKPGICAEIHRLHSELESLRARYDAVQTIKRIKADVGWAEHTSWQSLGDVSARVVSKLGSNNENRRSHIELAPFQFEYRATKRANGTTP